MGAGSAGLGVVYSLYHGMIAQGMKPEDAAKNFWLIDKDGLITSSRVNMAEGQVMVPPKYPLLKFFFSVLLLEMD